MSHSVPAASEPDREPRRKLRPWVITFVLGLLFALGLSVWMPQEESQLLLARIDEAGGFYSIDISDRPEDWSMIEDFEYLEWFDEVDGLYYSQTVPDELIRDAVEAFTSLETLEFSLTNSPGVDHESVSQLTNLRGLEVFANERAQATNYRFLAGCQLVENLVLEGEYHDDRFWQYLPDMKSLTTLELTVGPDVHGEEIPDLSESNLLSVKITGVDNMSEFRGVEQLLNAPHLRTLEIFKVNISDVGPFSLDNPPPLKNVFLLSCSGTETLLETLSQVDSLRSLALTGVAVGDELIDILMSFSGLSGLELDATHLSDEAIFRLADHPSLKYLQVEGNVSGELIEQFRARVKQRGRVFPTIR